MHQSIEQYRKIFYMSTILVVEDTMTQAEIITSSLRNAGFNTLLAMSGAEARSKISQQKPSAIVLDVVLPNESGFELCRDLKDKPETKDIPIVLCSTKSGEMDKFWGMKQGASAYLTKPVDVAELIRTIKLLVKD
jgi:two-component system, chemotaxis family, response regulator PixH